MPRKPARKAQSKKAPAKPARRPAAKKPAPKARTAPTRAGASGPQRITTGSGASPEQIGRSLVEMFNKGQFKQIETKWWSPAIVSVEGMGMAWNGRDAVLAKNAEWYQKNDILGAAAEGPYVGASGFSVKFRMDVRDRAAGKRTIMEEVGVYTVHDGKIIREEFMYGAAYPGETTTLPPDSIR